VEAGGAARDDSFRPYLIPLLRELLLEPTPAAAKPSAATGAGTPTAAEEPSGGGGAPAAAEAVSPCPPSAKDDEQSGEPCVMRTDAPRLAVVTDIGQQVSEAADGAELLTEARVRGLIDGRLRTRLANELRLPVAVLCAHMPVYHSFLPQRDAFAELDPSDLRLRGGAAARGPWTKAWTKPAPGQLLQAMADCCAAPHETLVIGRDARDREAARRAGVACILFGPLCSEVELERHLVTPDAPAAGSLAPAPFTGSGH